VKTKHFRIRSKPEWRWDKGVQVLNYAPGHEDVWGSAGIDTRILNLGTRQSGRGGEKKAGLCHSNYTRFSCY